MLFVKYHTKLAKILNADPGCVQGATLKDILMDTAVDALLISYYNLLQSMLENAHLCVQVVGSQNWVK